MSRQRTVADFLTHFHSLRGIDPRRTNHDLVNLLFNYDRMDHRTPALYSRGSGATTVLLEFAKWTDQQILVISSYVDLWKHHGIRAVTWRTSIRGLMPRPELVLVDHALSDCDRRSRSTCMNYNRVVDRIPCPVIEVFTLTREEYSAIRVA